MGFLLCVLVVAFGKFCVIGCDVTYVVKEKSNTHIYTILSEHLIYEGFLS